MPEAFSWCWHLHLQTRDPWQPSASLQLCGLSRELFAALFDANISIRADFLLAKGEPCSYKKEEPSRGRC